MATQSARRPATTVLPSAGRPTISPMASRSAVVSVMITIITMVIDRIAANSKVGKPKWNGVDTANQAASPIRLKSTMPSGQAISVPAASPTRMAIRLKKPGRNR